MTTPIEVPSPVPNARAYKFGPCNVIVAREWHGARDRWHLSISNSSRYPTWKEVLEVREALLPEDVNFAMLLPAKERVAGIHRFCLHLWEVEADLLER